MAVWGNVHLVGGLEHECYFSIYWECHHPNSTTNQKPWVPIEFPEIPGIWKVQTDFAGDFRHDPKVRALCPRRRRCQGFRGASAAADGQGLSGGLVHGKT